jgi:hypothetical protein
VRGDDERSSRIIAAQTLRVSRKRVCRDSRGCCTPQVEMPQVEMPQVESDLFEMRRLESLSNTIFGVAMTLPTAFKPESAIYFWLLAFGGLVVRRLLRPRDGVA